ncbi:hypothetical protein JVT61DRAFT_6883 [Boletus reticuloceps]|uniref:Uncharacterized protein n=1 Tax=Boletus reticuloceps TaxID=495285 RepID=A0A8I2YJU9_9AGAM|nr:hypothetical protein JVT61DRAFT_6883 [Boletus reticuloceps]
MYAYGFNLSKGKWRMNDMQRNGGQFLWKQIYNARRAGVHHIYGVVWDEYDEGTIFMPVNPSLQFIAPDVDGYELPFDRYMRILGYAAKAFHREHTLLGMLPVNELQDYRSTRLCYAARATKNRRRRSGHAFEDTPARHSVHHSLHGHGHSSKVHAYQYPSYTGVAPHGHGHHHYYAQWDAKGHASSTLEMLAGWTL